MRRQKAPVPVNSAGARELVSSLIFVMGALVLIAAVFAVYSPSLDYQFILDDHHYLGDPGIQTSGHIWDYFRTQVWAQIAVRRRVFIVHFLFCGNIICPSSPRPTKLRLTMRRWP